MRALLTIAGNPALTTPDSGRLEGARSRARVDGLHRSLPERDDAPRGRDPAAAFACSRSRTTTSPSPLSRSATSPTSRRRCSSATGIAVGVRDPGPPRRDRRGARRRRRRRRRSRARRCAGRVSEAVARSGIVVHGRDPAEIVGGARRPAGRGEDARSPPPHRSSRRRVRREPGRPLARGARGQPHGIDFGPLEPRLPAALATESGKVELAPAALLADLGRLEQALAAAANGGMVLVGRRQLRTANSWTQNVPVLVRGKDTCVAQIHPTMQPGSGSSTAPPRPSARRPARSRSPSS